MECPICLDVLEDRAGITLNCCGQRLHTRCYVRCLPLCPLCRANHEKVIEDPVPDPDPDQVPGCARTCIHAFSTITTIAVTIFIITNLQQCS
jgi:hypothetical protein